MSQTKTERFTSDIELWLAIKQLYQWRQGFNSSWVGRVFDCLNRGEDVVFIQANTPVLKEAYDLWKAAPNEENFWKLHFIRPDKDETA